MRSGIRLGKIFNIEIFIDYSWFLIFAIIAWLLAASYYPSFNLGTSILQNILFAVLTAILFFSSVLTHELAHSVVANRYGLKIERISLFIFGGVAELFDEPTDAKTEFKVAIVGPFISLVIAVIFFLLYLLIQKYSPNSIVSLFAITLSEVNVLLAGFNLLPGFPLDGGRILRSVVWMFNKNLQEATRIATLSGRVIAAAIVILGIVRVLTTDFFGGIWLILIGIFLYQAAGQNYLELLIKLALNKVKVREVMNPAIVTVTPFLTINDLIEEYFLRHNYTALPVVLDNTVVGIVTLNDIRANSSKLNEMSRVHEVMRKVNNNIFLNQDDKVIDALKKMVDSKVSFVSVKRDEKLVGILTMDDIVNYLADKKVI